MKLFILNFSGDLLLKIFADFLKVQICAGILERGHGEGPWSALVLQKWYGAIAICISNSQESVASRKEFRRIFYVRYLRNI